MSQQNTPNLIESVYSFYSDGFKGMILGKKLWTIIFIKLFIMFFILKVFFFQDYLGKNFENDKQRGDFVLQQLTLPISNSAKIQTK